MHSLGIRNQKLGTSQFKSNLLTNFYLLISRFYLLCKHCLQPVVSVGVQGVQNHGLYTRLLATLLSRVQKITSCTTFKPGGFRVVFHGLNRYFKPVQEIVIPVVHTTNKCNDKIFINYFSY